MASALPATRFQTFAEFYPFYLGEHANATCRRLHFIGSSLVLVLAVALIATGDWRLALAIPLAGYGFAWVGHFFFEKNKPASFKQPLFSLMGDWVMYRDIWTGRIKF